MRLFASASVLAAAASAASPALAEGTAAGTTITNTVTLNYKVGTVDQVPVSASDTFTVDRKVNLVVEDADLATTSVSPGQENAVVAFKVTNASNAPLDLSLAAAQLSGGSAGHGGTDSFDGSNLRLFLDTNGNETFDAGDLTGTYLDQVAADSTRWVFVVSNMPLNVATNDVAGIRLTATAAEATAPTTLGAIITQTTGANTAGVDTVFADSDADGNVARDGIHFDIDDYTVLAASLTATKRSRVISDPFNGTTNPKMIPGAVVEYCISVANAAGSATATNVSLSDPVPAQTDYLAAFGIKLNGTVTGTTCNADGTDGGSYVDGTVSGTLADIAAGTARTLLFRVSVK
jgi:uncharacterized repeat protein (TIGR01451 family)